jgi:hypothetical protein
MLPIQPKVFLQEQLMSQCLDFRCLKKGIWQVKEVMMTENIGRVLTFTVLWEA